MFAYYVQAGVARDMRPYYTHPNIRISAHIKKVFEGSRFAAVVTGFEKEIYDQGIPAFEEIQGTRIVLALRPIPIRLQSKIRNRLESLGFWVRFEPFELPKQGAFAAAIADRTSGLFKAYVKLVAAHLLQLKERRQEALRKFKAAFRRLLRRVLGRLEGVLDHPGLARWARMIVRSGENAKEADDG